MLCVLACTSRNLHASLPQISTTNFAIGDHLAPEQKRNTASGITSTLEDHTAAFLSTATSLAVKSAGSAEPHVDLAAYLFCGCFTPFLPPFYPNGAVLTLFLPRFYPSGAAFTPLLPRFYPVFTLFLPRFYSFFTPARRVKSHVYPIFTPFLPCFYPVFTPFLPFHDG